MARRPRNPTRREYRAKQRAHRATVGGELSWALHDLRGELRLTREELANECGVSESLVERWEDPDDPCLPGAHDVAMFPLELRRRYLSAVAGEDISVVEAVPVTETTAEGLALLCHAMTEANEFHVAFARACETEGGRFTDDELVAIVREGTEAIAVGTKIVNGAKLEQRRRRSAREARLS